MEVLKDGASAIYGTDAIGGVINFITRKDYTGRRRERMGSRHRERRRRQKHRRFSAGSGDLARDRFNVFGVLDVQRLDALRSGQRAFIAERPLATTLPALMSSNTYPANIDISARQRTALVAAGRLPAGTTAAASTRARRVAIRRQPFTPRSGSGRRGRLQL